MPDSVEKQLETLSDLPKDNLAQLWQRLFHSVPDPKIRKPLMIRLLAYRIQEQAHGSLSATSQRRLRQMETSVKGGPNFKTPLPKLQPGTRLVREWQNEVHVVNVETKGYEYCGGRYKSLSEIARLITGTRWSGPLFFGIKNDHQPAQELQ